MATRMKPSITITITTVANYNIYLQFKAYDHEARVSRDVEKGFHCTMLAVRSSLA